VTAESALTAGPEARVTGRRFAVVLSAVALSYLVVGIASVEAGGVRRAVPLLAGVGIASAGVVAYLLHLRATVLADERLRWVAYGYGLSGLAAVFQTAQLDRAGLVLSDPLEAAPEVVLIYVVWHLAVPLHVLTAGAVRRGARRARAAMTACLLLGIVLTVEGPAALTPTALVAADGTYSSAARALFAAVAVVAAVAAVRWLRDVGTQPTWPEAWVGFSLVLLSANIAFNAAAQGLYEGVWWASFVLRFAAMITPAVGLLVGLRSLFTSLQLHEHGLAEQLESELADARELQRGAAATSAIDPEAEARIIEMLTIRRFRIVYQPIVHLHTGTIVGAEALTRFEGPLARTPDRWFAEAAQVGLGVELELATLHAALEGLDELPPTAYLSLNASPQLIGSGRLRRVLAPFSGERIVLEITEHAAVERYDLLFDSLEELRSAGVRVAIDDAGAGFSSLRHIVRMAPDIIKLDQSLTEQVERDPVRRALTRLLVGFAIETSATIVAEGIETAEQRATLRQLGVACGQGFHLARPGPLPLPETIASVQPVAPLARRRGQAT
jgi:EAL domain-containing protein (putative c-di-GMP-specific phosphodiesterase class I)